MNDVEMGHDDIEGESGTERVSNRCQKVAKDATDTGEDTNQMIMTRNPRCLSGPSPEIAALKPNHELIDSPVRGKIKKGSVAAIKEAFDKLAEKEKEAERNIKRLNRSCLKPRTPGKSSGSKKGSRKSKKKEVLSLNQALIIDYYRKAGGDEMGSESS